jgi:hypothetical protein
MSQGLCSDVRLSFQQGTAILAAVMAAVALTLTPASADQAGEWANSMIKRDIADTDRAVRTTTTTRTTTRQARRSGRQTYTALARSEASPVRRSAPSITSGAGGSVRWVASSGCLNGTLRSVVSGLAASYGPLTVSSTCRSSGHNRRVGGAPRSLHLSGDAVDFRIHQNVSAAYASLRSNGSVGGLKHYGGGLFHIDTGARRSW